MPCPFAGGADFEKLVGDDALNALVSRRRRLRLRIGPGRLRALMPRLMADLPSRFRGVRRGARVDGQERPGAKNLGGGVVDLRSRKEAVIHRRYAQPSA